MFTVFMIDGDWCGIGIDWLKHAKGIRLGYISFHIVFCKFDTWCRLLKDEADKL